MRKIDILRIMIILLAVPALSVAETPAPDTPIKGFTSDRAGFLVSVNELICPYDLLAFFVRPGAHLEMAVEAGQGTFHCRAETGRITAPEVNRWHWDAPEKPGMYPVRITETGSGRTMTFHVFVLVPYERVKNSYLDGYRIGRYPDKPLKEMAIYLPPIGFVRVTPENLDTPVSPHFTLGQFLCKQDGGYPKYLVLRTRLLLKLELILERVNAAGYACSTFHVMSGYRTPWYNAALKDAPYSRHMWGGAADIYIDENPRDKWMDDLNRDGRIDLDDAKILYNIIDGLYGEDEYQPLMGGLARYRKTAAHGPFVHVDVRGFRARWGE